jgi:hypothetical protein
VNLSHQIVDCLCRKSCTSRKCVFERKSTSVVFVTGFVIISRDQGVLYVIQLGCERYERFVNIGFCM